MELVILEDLDNISEEMLVNAIEENTKKYLKLKDEIKQLEIKFSDNSEKEQPVVETLNSITQMPELFETEKDDDFEKEVDYYFSQINNLASTSNLQLSIADILPSKENVNYYNINLRIKMELLKNIKEIEELLNQEKANLTKEDYEEFKDEILLNQEKIKIISTLETINEIEQGHEPIKNNFIFVPTSSGNIRILKELKDIDQEYYEGFKDLFASIEDGRLKNIRRFKSINNLNSGVCEVKDYKIRVVFDQIGPHDYALITAFIKKSDKDKGYLDSLNLKIKNYESQKELLKENLNNPEFRQLQNEYTLELNNILNVNDKGNFEYKKS